LTYVIIIPDVDTGGFQLNGYDIIIKPCSGSGLYSSVLSGDKAPVKVRAAARFCSSPAKQQMVSFQNGLFIAGYSRKILGLKQTSEALCPPDELRERHFRMLGCQVIDAGRVCQSIQIAVGLFQRKITQAIPGFRLMYETVIHRVSAGNGYVGFLVSVGIFVCMPV